MVLNISVGYSPAIRVCWAMCWSSLHVWQMEVSKMVMGVYKNLHILCHGSADKSLTILVSSLCTHVVIKAPWFYSSRNSSIPLVLFSCCVKVLNDLLWSWHVYGVPGWWIPAWDFIKEPEIKVVTTSHKHLRIWQTPGIAWKCAQISEVTSAKILAWAQFWLGEVGKPVINCLL